MRERRIVVHKDAVGLKTLPKGVTSAWGGTRVYERVWTVHVVEEVLPGESPTGTVWFREGKQWLETEQMKFGDKKALDIWVKDLGLAVLKNPPDELVNPRPYTLAELKALPTLSQNNFMDLKVDTPEMRVWLSRMTVADGAPYEHQVIVEKYLDDRWQVVESYEPLTNPSEHPVGRALPAEEFFSRETIDKVMKRNLELWEDTVEAMALRTMTGLQTDDTPIQAVARAYRTDEATVRQTPIMLDVLKRVKTWMENPSEYAKERAEHPTLPAKAIRQIVKDHDEAGHDNPPCCSSDPTFLVNPASGPQFNLKWTSGNTKLSKTGTLCFSLPRGRPAMMGGKYACKYGTCPGAGECVLSCYTKSGQFILLPVQATRVWNYKASLKADFIRKASEDLDRIFKDGVRFYRLGKVVVPTSVRLHDEGDFYSQTYVDKWARIIARYPQARWYAYTKSYGMMTFKRMPKNFLMVQSMGGTHDKKADPRLPIARVFGFRKKDDKRTSPTMFADAMAEMRKQGYVYGSYVDLPAFKACPKRIGLMEHLLMTTVIRMHRARLVAGRTLSKEQMVLIEREIEEWLESLGVGTMPAALLREYKDLMKKVHANPARPPRDWFKRCIAGVSRHGGSVDPRRVCGSLWHHKMGPGAKRKAMTIENPKTETPYIEGSDYMDENEWEFMVEHLTKLMHEMNPSGNWHAEVKGFGWRGVSGHMEFEATTGKQLLQEILPKTECHFRVYKRKGHIAINNAHHDSPTWAEWYYVYPRDYKNPADETEGIRREMLASHVPGERADLEDRFGQVWDTDQLRAEFDVIGFMAPFCVVRRKADGVKGSLMFQHSPRYYFSFTADNPLIHLGGVDPSLVVEPQPGRSLHTQLAYRDVDGRTKIFDGHDTKFLVAHDNPGLLPDACPARDVEAGAPHIYRQGFCKFCGQPAPEVAAGKGWPRYQEARWAGDKGRWVYNPPEPAKDKNGANGYIVYWDKTHKSYEVYADSSYGACKKLAEQLGAKKGTVGMDATLVEKGGEQVTTFPNSNPCGKHHKNWGECPVCGGPGYGPGEICMDCVRARHRAALTHRCSCGRKRQPKKVDLGFRRYTACERCLGVISQENPGGKRRGIGQAWQGSLASFISKPGRYGLVGASELAMHTGIAEKEIIQYSLFVDPQSRREGKPYVTYAQVRTADGRITDGLPGEVLSAELMRKHGLYGQEHLLGNPWGSGDSFTKGTPIVVSKHHSKPGKGLSYASFKGRMAEDGHAGGWDVWDVVNEKGETVPVYGFSIGRHKRGNPLTRKEHGTLVGRKCLTIETTTGKCHGPMGAVYGLDGGTVMVKGFFKSLPSGKVKAMWYADEAKARREKMSNPLTPWKHDFSSEDVSISRCRGGILLRGKRPLWGMR